MNASIPQFAAQSSGAANSLPASVAPTAGKLAGSQNDHKGSLVTAQTGKPEALPPGKLEAFSHAWASALQQTEEGPGKRLRNTKGLVAPLPDPKQARQEHANNSTSIDVFTSDKAAPLPLTLSLAPSTGAKDAYAPRPLPEKSSVHEDDRLQITSGEVAFTAKFKGPQSNASVEKPAVVTPPAAVGESSSKPTTSAQTAEAVQIVKAAVDVAPVSPGTSSISVESAPSSPKIGSASHAEPIETTIAAPAAAPQPLKEIAFQLPGARGVEVRLTERAGEVHIDVRSGDNALTQDLRNNLHDLVANLERKGISAEVSHPQEHATAPASRSADTGASKDQTPGGQGGADRQPQQRNRQPGQPAELTNSKARGSAWTEQANSSFGKENQ